MDSTPSHPLRVGRCFIKACEFLLSITSCNKEFNSLTTCCKKNHFLLFVFSLLIICASSYSLSVPKQELSCYLPCLKQLTVLASFLPSFGLILFKSQSVTPFTEVIPQTLAFLPSFSALFYATFLGQLFFVITTTEHCQCFHIMLYYSCIMFHHTDLTPKMQANEKQS